MQNYLIELSYIGTQYHGFQIQKNADTVQQRFQQALVTVLGFLPDIKGCSRTDTGVHAKCFCISFFTENPVDIRKFLRSINALLPDDIRVMSIREVSEGFHARYSCVSKTYEYLICNAQVMDPFLNGRALHYLGDFDCETVNSVLSVIEGTHDFSALCGIKGRKEDMTRTVFRCEVSREGSLITLTASADGFLYNMVRIIVGSAISAARGRLDSQKLNEILLSGERSLLCPTAPAHGLYLSKVEYNEF